VAPPAAAVSAAAEEGPLRLTLAGALVRGLERNRSLAVQRLAPLLARASEEGTYGRFDPEVAGRISLSSARSPGAGGDYDNREALALEGSLQKVLEDGTTLAAGVATQLDDTDQAESSRVEISATRPLRQGAGREVNLVAVRQAALDTTLSLQELRGYTMDLAAQIETAYWELLAAGQGVTIARESLQLARDQLEETRERIRVGKLAGIELVTAQAEEAVRGESLINAQSLQEKTRLRLVRLLGPSGAADWDRPLVPEDAPALPEGDLPPVEAHVRTALEKRPDLAEARLRLERGDLEVERTANGLLPRLDLFLALGRTTYRSSFLETVNLGGQAYDASAGLSLKLPLFNRAADAAHRRAVLGARQLAESLENMAQLVELDVRTAWVEAGRLRAQIAATASTRLLMEEKLRGETEKFRVGKSTAYLVAQAQRDLAQARVEEAAAVMGFLKALTELHRLDGSLLERRGLQVTAAGDSAP
jgi:outer membrane protein TolC